MNKTYFRILGYAPNLRPRMVKFFIFAVLGVLFQAIYLGLTMPMMKVLFDKKDNEPVAYPTEFNLRYPGDLFKYHFKQYADNDPISALIFVCIGIVIFVFLSNIFRYLERMTASPRFLPSTNSVTRGVMSHDAEAVTHVSESTLFGKPASTLVLCVYWPV